MGYRKKCMNNKHCPVNVVTVIKWWMFDGLHQDGWKYDTCRNFSKKISHKMATVFGRLRRHSSIILTFPGSMFTVLPCLTFRNSTVIPHNVSFL